MRERRTVADDAADREVRRALRSRAGSATVADISVATALPEATAGRSLERLLERYDGAVGVAKGGTLIYRFRIGALGLLRARRERQLWWRAAVNASATVATAFISGARALFRGALAVQLLLYLVLILTPVSVVIGAVIGVVLAVVLFVAAIFSGDGSGLEAILETPELGLVFIAGCVVYGIYRVFKQKISWIMAAVGKDERGKGGVAGFITQVNDFALGPDAPPSRRGRIDRAWTVSATDERVVLARVRARGGRLRAGDLVAWLGLDLDAAERQATRICVDYGGEPAMADIDVVEFDLRGLLVTTGDATSLQPEEKQTTHERGDELVEPRFTANQTREDVIIVSFAVLNVIAGAIGWVAMSAQPGTVWRVAEIAGGVVPISCGALLIVMPLARAPVVWLRRTLRRRARARAALHDLIVAHARRRADAVLDLDKAAVKAGLDVREARPVAVRLGGSFDLAVDGAGDPSATVWRFARLGRELARRQVEKLRVVKELDEDR